MENDEQLILLTKIIDLLGDQIDGDIKIPNEGISTANYFVKTKKYKELVIRVREAEDSTISFEARVLNFLKDKPINVPKIVSFSDGTIERVIGNKRVLAYIPIKGKTVSTAELSNTQITIEASQLLAKLINYNSMYTPDGGEPTGDIDYVKKIYLNFINDHSQFKSSQFFSDALPIIEDPKFNDLLSNTPKGIVHADYFYENIIQDQNNHVVGVIDFGDAYFGCVLNDIVIGSMEFSVLEKNEVWDKNLFELFLTQQRTWLIENKIDFELFMNVLLMNCLRFAIYTLGFELEENPKSKIENNRYVKRFYSFNGRYHQDINEIYNRLTN